MVYRKKNQELLPNEPTKVQKIIGYGGPLDMGGNQDKAPPENKTGQLLFDTDFECGNIDQVRQRSPVEYDLWMRNDTNGSSNLQWFYFRMQNPAMCDMIRINVVNFTKGNSLFYYGMKPSFWSLKSHLKNG